MDQDGVKVSSPELLRLRTNKQDGYNYRFRREEDWRENYTLYRDRVLINRLTQRQSINLPIMKTQLRTLLSNVDDMPVLVFENLDNDKQAELFQNEYWKYTIEQNQMELKDIVDKKQDFFFGRSFDQMQIADGMVKMSIIDPEDILISRYTDATNINAARFLIHTHIFQPMSAVENNPDYDKKAIANMKLFYATNEGLIKAKSNLELLILKNEKMADLGVLDAYEPLLSETYLELSLHFVYREEEKDTDGTVYKNQYWLYVECDDMEILQKIPLEKKIGTTIDHYWQTHLPYNTWADDIDNQDFWTDGIADIIRTPNKVINVLYSQLIENRALKSLNMNFYDATNEAFTPQTYEPKAFAMFGVPGNPNEIMMPVPVGNLDDSTNDIEFINGILQAATGANATQQGEQTPTSVTLGEVQLDLQAARERVKGMSKFYTQVWKDRGEKFLKLIEAAPEKLDAVRIYKKGLNTDNTYSREIEPKDWMTKLGHRVQVWEQDDKDTQDSQKLNKLNAAVSIMPGNQPLMDIFERTILEFSDLKPEQIQAVMQAQQKLMQQQAMMAQQSMGGMPGQPMTPGQPPTALPSAPLNSPAGQPAGNPNAGAINKLQALRSQIQTGG